MRIVSFLSSFLRRPCFAVFACAALLAPRLLAQANSPSAADGFDPNVNGVVNAVVVQADGKILLAGNFTMLQPNGSNAAIGRNNLARLNADGTVDGSFNPNVNDQINALAMQPDGKILIAGFFTTLQPNGAATATARNRLARLNADGTLDATFDPNATNPSYAASARYSVNALAVQADGKILVGGDFTKLQPNGATTATTRNRLARLNADGTLDATFDPNVNAAVLSLAVQPNGSILVGGGFTTVQPNGATTATTRNHLARLDAKGNVDTAFDPNTNGGVAAIALEVDGGIVIGGYFTTLQPNGADSTTTRTYLARLNSDGSLDTSFANPNANGFIYALALQPDGKILVGGNYTAMQPNGVALANTHGYLARLNRDGSLDDAFNPTANYVVSALAVQPDGKILAGGNFTQMKPNGATVATNRNRLARLNLDGTLDASLDPNANSRILALAVQPDGKILLGGLTFPSIGGVQRKGVARLNANGSLDANFNPNANDRVFAIVVLSDGRILLGGAFTTIGGVTRNHIARLNSDGSLDTSFDPNLDSQVNVLAVQPDGKILVGGFFTLAQPNGATAATLSAYILRLNADGTLDTNFKPAPNAPIDTIALQSDGKIIIGGQFTTLAPNGSLTLSLRDRIARLNSDGTLDAGFDPLANGQVNAVAVQSDGKILLGGAFTTLQPNGATTATTRNHLARLNTDGTLDTTFDPNVNGPVTALQLQGNSILVGGAFSTVQPNGVATATSRNNLARLNADGTPDLSFDPSPNGSVDVVVQQSSGSLLLGGRFSALQQTNGGALVSVSLPVARVSANGVLDTSFVLGSGGVAGAQVNALALQADGRLLLGGTFPSLAGATTRNIARFNVDSSADTAFGPDADGPVNALVVRPDNGGIAAPATGFAWLTTDGTLRTGFTTDSSTVLRGKINAVAVQANGQILVGGTFSNLSGATGSNLLRFNADGTLDTSFNPAPNGQVNALAIQSDGKILVAGAFTTLQPIGATTITTRNRIARLNPDGSLDTGFDPNASNVVSALKVQTDGKILLGGSFTTFQPNGASGSTAANYVARLNTDGTLDTAFYPNPNGAVNALVLQPDGKIVLGGAFTTLQPSSTTDAATHNYLARVNADGSLDANFNPSGGGVVLALALQTDGAILVGGGFTTFGGALRSGVARVNSSGILDDAFNPSVVGQVNTLVVQTDGRILVGGAFTGIAGTTRARLARLDRTGVLDLTFDPNFDGAVNTLVTRSDGTLLVGGAFSTLHPAGVVLVGGAFKNIGGGAASNLALLVDDGTLAGTFQANPDGEVKALLLQPDNRTLVAGAFTHIAGAARNRLARLNADGSLDTAFAPSALGTITALALQADGKILAAGPFSSGVSDYASLARLNADGSLDGAFKPGLIGAITALTVQADGKVLVATPNALLRLNTDGTRDAGFTPTFTGGGVNALVLQADGRILVGGAFTTVNGVARNRLARLNADGSLDATYDPNANGSISALALQSDGKPIVGGAFTAIGGQGRFLFARLMATSSATESIAVSSDLGAITWTRNGSAPELAGATFEQSTDSITWTSLGVASRVGASSNWRLSGLQMPANTLFFVRARGIVPTSQNSSSGLVETVRAFDALPAPTNTIANTVGGTTGASFTYTPALVSGPATYTATGLPAGLTINSTTGTISGTATQSGTFKVSVTATSSSGTTSAALSLIIAAPPAASTSRLISLSARALVNSGNPLIAGYAIGGTGSKGVLQRAVGPTLATFGVSGALAAPSLQLYDATGKLLLGNTGWGGTSSLTAAFLQVGAFALPPTSADSAAVSTLASGSLYTVQVLAVGSASGVALAEIYDTDTTPVTAAARLTSVSARALVVDGNPLIGGLNVAGTTPKRVLVRGVGPGLVRRGVTAAMADPVLYVFDGNKQLIAQNDNWQTPVTVTTTQVGMNAADISAAFSTTGAFTLDNGSTDAALIVTLAPGLYTVQVVDANRASGTALVEIYELP